MQMDKKLQFSKHEFSPPLYPSQNHYLFVGQNFTFDCGDLVQKKYEKIPITNRVSNTK